MITKIYENSGFILAFLVATIFLSMFAGKKVTQSFLLLILFSQFLINPDLINSLKFEAPEASKTSTSGMNGVVLL